MSAPAAFLIEDRVVDHEVVGGKTYVFIEVSEDEARDFASSVYDRWEGVVTLRLPLTELIDYPTCERCDEASLDRVLTEEGRLCPLCTPEARAEEERRNHGEYLYDQQCDHYDD